MIVGLIQDFLTTSYLITQKDVFYDRSQFSLICTYFNDANEQIDLPTPTIIYPRELWTGKQVISTLLRPNRFQRIILNLECAEKNYKVGESMDLNDGWVLIKNAELLSGNLGKIVLGQGSKVKRFLLFQNGLFYALQRDNSKSVCAQVMQRFSKLSSRWINQHGVTFGVTDVQPSALLRRENLLSIQIA
jgi:DNA-directed RNA polymerase III subunit RPC1